jgi:hypothetical protein
VRRGEDQNYEPKINRHPPDRDRGYCPRGQNNQCEERHPHPRDSRSRPKGAGLRPRRKVSTNSGSKPFGSWPWPCVRCARRHDQDGSALPAARCAVMAGQPCPGCPVSLTGLPLHWSKSSSQEEAGRRERHLASLPVISAWLPSDWQCCLQNPAHSKTTVRMPSTSTRSSKCHRTA